MRLKDPLLEYAFSDGAKEGTIFCAGEVSMLSFYFHLPSDEPGAPAVCGDKQPFAIVVRDWAYRVGLNAICPICLREGSRKEDPLDIKTDPKRS